MRQIALRDDAGARSGTGIEIRAKTGTLNYVATPPPPPPLAGYVRTCRGATLAFAFLASDMPRRIAANAPRATRRRRARSATIPARRRCSKRLLQRWGRHGVPGRTKAPAFRAGSGGATTLAADHRQKAQRAGQQPDPRGQRHRGDPVGVEDQRAGPVRRPAVNCATATERRRRSPSPISLPSKIGTRLSSVAKPFRCRYPCRNS